MLEVHNGLGPADPFGEGVLLIGGRGRVSQDESAEDLVVLGWITPPEMRFLLAGGPCAAP
eukprot:12317891-Heterocapsa_arctica.AAC.1